MGELLKMRLNALEDRIGTGLPLRDVCRSACNVANLYILFGEQVSFLTLKTGF